MTAIIRTTDKVMSGCIKSLEFGRRGFEAVASTGTALYSLMTSSEANVSRSRAVVR